MNDDSIKLMSLLEELEDLITSSSKMPFSEKGIIDLDVATKILEDIRANLPRDIQQARWLDQERDRIISDAKKEYNDAITYYTKAIAQDGDFAEAYYNRGLTYVYIGENEKGLSDLSKAGELGIYQAYNLITRFK